MQPLGRLWRFQGHQPHIALVFCGIAIAVASVVSDTIALLWDTSYPYKTIDYLRVAASVASSLYLCLVLLRPPWAPIFLALSWLLILPDPAPGGLIPFVYLGLAFAAFTSSGRIIALSLGVTFCWATVWVPLTSNLPNEALWGYIPVTLTFAIPGITFQALTEKITTERRRRVEAEAATALARVQERKDLARELHDIVAHELTIIAMQARAGALTNDLEDAREALNVIGDSSRSGLEEMRRLIAVMRADGVADAPVDPGKGAGHELDLPRALTRAQEKLVGVDIPTSVEVLGEPHRVPAGLRVTVLAVLREGTTNVIKHAGRPATCNLALTVTDAQVSLSIRNTVPGQKLDFPASGFGLVGVGERVAVLGGDLVSQREGSEWLLSVRIPLKDTRAAPGVHLP